MFQLNQLFIHRAQLAKAFDIKIGHSDFTSKYSIAIAEKAGFKLDRAIT